MLGRLSSVLLVKTIPPSLHASIKNNNIVSNIVYIISNVLYK